MITQFSIKQAGSVYHKPKTDILPRILKLTIMNRTFLNILNLNRFEFVAVQFASVSPCQGA